MGKVLKPTCGRINSVSTALDCTAGGCGFDSVDRTRITIFCCPRDMLALQAEKTACLNIILCCCLRFPEMKDTKLKSIIQTTLFTSGVSPPVKKLHKCRDRSVTGSLYIHVAQPANTSVFHRCDGRGARKGGAFEGYMKPD